MNIDKFEKEWGLLKKNGEHSFIYADSHVSMRSIINSHFGGYEKKKTYGVYMIRQKATSDVLYIGKGGTIDQDGKFKNQDIPSRLVNVRGQKTSQEWFESLFKEKGALVVEYAILTTPHKSPAFVEACLMQAYLNEHDCLPYRNSEFYGKRIYSATYRESLLSGQHILT